MQGKINSINVDAGSYITSGANSWYNWIIPCWLQFHGVEVQIRSLQKDIDRYTILTEADAIQGVRLEKTKSAIEGALGRKLRFRSKSGNPPFVRLSAEW